MTKKVNFNLSANIVANANAGVLLGDFNNWDVSLGCPLKKDKTGALKCTLALEIGKTYQYRYLLNDGRWVNDDKANAYVVAESFQVQNCVITVTPATKTIVKKTNPALVKNDEEKIIAVKTKKVVTNKSTGVVKNLPVKQKVAKATATTK
jgi:1,4-alpha-glucan branching enzyme